MATPTRPTSASSSSSTRPDSAFTRKLRFEWASEEERALMGSYAISGSIGIAFLLLVHLTPVRQAQADEPPPAREYLLSNSTPPEPTKAADGGSPKHNRGLGTETNVTEAIRHIFGTGSEAGTGTMTVDVSGILRGVDVNSRSDGTAGKVEGKRVLSFGPSGQSASTPGRGGSGVGLRAGTGGEGGVGSVGGGRGVTAARVSVRAPAVLTPTYTGRASRDASELGNFVRSRQEQLRFCYAERGLKVNPSLAGTINVSITLTGSGNVTDAAVTNRTWSGGGAAEAESCIIQQVRSWRFPSASAGGGTYSFPFNFTR
jgi:hypothetical protein